MTNKRRNHGRILRLEALDQRRCLAADLSFTFSAADLDVNRDGHVTPQDALAVVNALIQGAELRAVAGGEGEAGSLDTDVNNDGVTSPGDAVIVINDLNDPSTPVTDSTATDTPAPSDATPSGEDANTTDTSTGVTDSDTPIPDTSTDSSGADTTTDPGDASTSDSNSDTSSADPSGTDASGADTTADEDDDASTCGNDNRLATVFNSHDTNQDGQLTSDEVPAGVWDRLSVADADASGGISLDELTAAVSEAPEHSHGGHHGGGSEGGHHSEGHHPENLFARLDANDDGALTADEMSTAQWDRISGADADANGSISAEELAAYRPAPPARGERLFDRLDANDDGALTADEMSSELWDRIAGADADANGSISVEELAAYHPTPASPVDRLFAQLDANEDGLLGADEVTEQIWQRLSTADTDGDGSVSKEELTAVLSAGAGHHTAGSNLTASGTTATESTRSPEMGRPMGRPQGRMMGRR